MPPRVIQWLPVGAVGSVRQGLKESGGPRDVKGDSAGAGRAGKEAWRVMWPRYVNSCNVAWCRCACCCWCVWCRIFGIARGRARWRLSSRSARLLWQREQSLSSARGDSRRAVWKMVVTCKSRTTISKSGRRLWAGVPCGVSCDRRMRQGRRHAQRVWRQAGVCSVLLARRARACKHTRQIVWE